jgi:hypothetical protein
MQFSSRSPNGRIAGSLKRPTHRDAGARPTLPFTERSGRTAVNAASRERLAGALRSAGARAKIGRTLASDRRAAAERARDWSERRQGARQRRELTNGFEPLDRQHNGRGDRLRGQETARKAGIFALGRRGMPVVVRRAIAGGAVSVILIKRADIAAAFRVTGMRRSRMIVQRVDRRRGQQIAGERKNNGNPF